MTFRPIVLGRVYAIGLGVAYAWAAAVTVDRAFSGPGFLGSVRWQLYVGQATILALIAVMTFAGATLHVAGLAAASATMLALMVARYDTESALAPAVGVSTAVLGFVYVRAGLGSVRALTPNWRIAALALSAVFAVIAMWRMEATPTRIDWDRVRTASGGVETQTFPSGGRCDRPRAEPPDEFVIDSGCIESMPTSRVVGAMAFGAAAAALGIAALAGAPRVRRLPDGMSAPTWT